MNREIALAIVAPLKRRRGRLQELIGFFRTKPLGAAGGVAIFLLCLAAVLAPWIAPSDPYAVSYENALLPPGREFIMGTDNFGRDMFSRVVWGSRISLYVGLLAVGLGNTVGGLLGVISAYWGGKFDLIWQRFMDSLMAFPALILALVIVAMLGPSVTNCMLAIAVVRVPATGRVLRSAGLAVRENQYVEAARAMGCTDARIVLYHIIPNCVAPFIIVATAGLGSAIITEATLSFLGVGAPPPTPSWGAMLSGQSRQFIQMAPWLAIFPGVAITIAVFGFNLLGDALRDVLDPRLRRT